MKFQPLGRGGRLLAAALLAAHALASPGAARQSGENPDVGALLSEVARKERAMSGRRLEYTWTAKIIERELNRAGGVKKEYVSVYEVYPVRGEFVRKLVSKDGVPVSKSRADAETRKAVERLERAAKEERKRGERKALPPQKPADAQNPAGIPSFGFSAGQKRGSGFGSSEISMAVWRFFRYAEFDSPRRERFRGRDAIVLDFRPRADFRPADEIQRPYARLAGRVWIDAADRAVVRLEAWPYDPQARAADLTDSARAPSVVFEHERLPDGTWLEHLFRIQTYGHEEVFNGIELDLTTEATAFRRFTALAGDEKLDPPKVKP